ncbi:MAG: 4Fe-4S dicluster domain-containing protein [Firmicutes bacterium]|nr:4Fe-4S dicluster domain-containing protein [Bacillota bacterium]MTI69661.1 4Fe-4S dicluster domain-containing protein [Bacillota bacterium]
MRYIKDIANITMDKDKCIGCKMCIKVCPHGVFSISEGKAFINYKDKCIECGACSKNCPKEAIKVSAGVG